MRKVTNMLAELAGKAEEYFVFPQVIYEFYLGLAVKLILLSSQPVE